MITSSHNPKIKLIRALAGRPKERRENGAFLAEGVRLVEEAFSAGWNFRFVLYTDGLGPRGQDLVKSLTTKGRRCGTRGGEPVSVNDRNRDLRRESWLCSRSTRPGPFCRPPSWTLCSSPTRSATPVIWARCCARQRRRVCRRSSSRRRRQTPSRPRSCVPGWAPTSGCRSFR